VNNEQINGQIYIYNIYINNTYFNIYVYNEMTYNNECKILNVNPKREKDQLLNFSFFALR